jgi:hypothetical protein
MTKKKYIVNIRNLNWNLRIMLNILGEKWIKFPIFKNDIESIIRAAEIELKDEIGLWQQVKYGVEIRQISDRFFKILNGTNWGKFERRAFKLQLLTLIVIFFSETEVDKNNTFNDELRLIYNDIFYNIESGIYPEKEDKEKLNENFKYLLEKIYILYREKI